MSRMFLVLLVASCLWVGLSTPKAQAQTRTDLRQAFVRVQEALALGNLKRFIQELKQLQIIYLSIQSKLPPEEKDQFQLWIYRFQFKRYQLQGALPNIRDVGSFENTEAVSDYIKQFSDATLALQKALLFLRRYNKLYNLLSLKQDLNAQINLQASLSLERDLEALIRQSQIYMALLRFALDNWANRKAVRTKAKQQDAEIELLRRQQRRATVERREIKNEQKRLANRVKHADGEFRNIQKAIDNQQAASIAFLVSGAVVAALGATSLIFGVLGLPDGNNTVNFSFLPNPNENKSSNGELSGRAQHENLNLILFSSGGGAMLLGVVFIIVGAVQMPPAKKRAAAVLKTQGKFLKEQTPPHTSMQYKRNQRRLAQHAPTLIGRYGSF